MLRATTKIIWLKPIIIFRQLRSHLGATRAPPAGIVRVGRRGRPAHRPRLARLGDARAAHRDLCTI
eukprot:5874280-Alexandrium_andersonii.AAC.1